MKPKATSIADLAREAGVDLDEALVTLWDFGFATLVDEHSTVPARNVRLARSSLGLDDSAAIRTVNYWLERSMLNREQLALALAEVGITLPTGTRRIPKNSLRRLRSLFPNERVATPEAVKPTSASQQVAAKPLVWSRIGNTQVRRYLSERDVELIHEALAADFVDSGDPIWPPGVRDHNLLSSAVHRPRFSSGDITKYPTVQMAAAALFHSLVQNHPFHNGNKRTGLVSLLAFLDANEVVLTCDQEELFRMTLKVAQHGLVPANSEDLSDREVHAIASWIRDNSRKLERPDKTMRWHNLKPLLARFGCECSTAVGVGHRLNIRRPVTRVRRFGRSKLEFLNTQVAWEGDKTECHRDTIRKIRADLELDDVNGIDSKHFYDGLQVDAFIIEYRRILRRLARL